MPRLTGLRLILLREARAACVIIALGKRAIEQLIQDHRLAHHLFGRGRISVVEKVPASQFNRIHADGRGNLVHVPLNGKDGLRCAKAAKRAVGHSVGCPRTRVGCAHWGTNTVPVECSVARESTVDESVE